MWEWLSKALCQKSYEGTHVWNLESQKHVTLPRQKRKIRKGLHRDIRSAPVELDWKQGRRMDSYFLEAATQTVIRQEVYKKISLQNKSQFHTKDLFSVSMRNVNERILNARHVVVPGSVDTGETSFEQNFLQESRVVHVQEERTRRDSYSSVHQQEDMDTIVTDVDEDSIEDGVREVCSDHVGMCLTDVQRSSR